MWTDCRQFTSPTRKGSLNLDAVGVSKSLFALLEFFGRPCEGKTTKSNQLCWLLISVFPLHLLFQLHIRIFVREPAEGEVVFKKENWLVKAVFG